MDQRARYAMSRGTPEHGRLLQLWFARFRKPKRAAFILPDTLIYIEKVERSTYGRCEASYAERFLRKGQRIRTEESREAITNPSAHCRSSFQSIEERDRNERFVHLSELDSLKHTFLFHKSERRIEVRTRVGNDWISETHGAGETIRIHDHEIAVDSVYA